METFRKAPKFVKLFQELNLTFVCGAIKKSTGFSHVCNAKFAAFRSFATGQHVKGGFFAIIDIFFIVLHRLLKHI